MSSESPPEADSEEGKLQGTNAGGQVRAAPVDVAAAMPSTDWVRQVRGWGGVRFSVGVPLPSYKPALAICPRV